MEKLGKIKVSIYDVTVFEQGRYPADKNTPIVVAFTADGDPYANISVCIPGAGVLLQKGEYLIKTWSENEPIAKALLDAGIFIDTGKRIPTGFVEAEIWKLV